jgi:hypothetical protein
MNKYQKVISMIAKCDLKKQSEYGFSYREVRNPIRKIFYKFPFERLRDYKNRNRNQPI